MSNNVAIKNIYQNQEINLKINKNDTISIYSGDVNLILLNKQESKPIIDKLVKNNISTKIYYGDLTNFRAISDKVIELDVGLEKIYLNVVDLMFRDDKDRIIKKDNIKGDWFKFPIKHDISETDWSYTFMSYLYYIIYSKNKSKKIKLYHLFDKLSCIYMKNECNAVEILGKNGVIKDNWNNCILDTFPKKPETILSISNKYLNLLKKINEKKYHNMIIQNKKDSLYKMIELLCNTNLNDYKNDIYKYMIDYDVRYTYDVFCHLVETYNCKPEKLFKYLYIDSNIISKKTFGIRDNIILLRDYLDMSKDYYGKIEVKYPKNLREEHDKLLVHVNRKSYKEHDDKILEINKLLKEKIEYEDENCDYIIKLPSHAGDIKSEGKILHHCVGSYINKHVEGKCVICFLRHKDKPDIPNITIELIATIHCNDNHYKIAQIQGKSRRSITEDEKKFLKKWEEVRKIY